MEDQKKITLKVTEKELALLRESVSYSVKSKHDKLLESCEGGYTENREPYPDGTIHIEAYKYEEYFDYENLAATLKSAGPLSF